MLDIKLLRNDINTVIHTLARRGFTLNPNEFNTLEEKRKALQVELETLKNQRNYLSKSIGQAKAKGESTDTLLQEVSGLGEQLAVAEAAFQTVSHALETLMQSLPNLPQADVPDGRDENDNALVRTWGTPRTVDFAIKDHIDLGAERAWLDFERAAKLSGARFVVMRGALVKLQRALIQFMLDMHINQHEYEEVYVPYLVNQASLYGTGQLPKFAEDLFHIEGQALSLISTAEIPVTNLVRDEILDAKQLPLKFVAHTPCFRSEAGAYGRDTRGLIRQHQFEKVELVWITEPEKSQQAHTLLTQHAESILQALALPYRVVNLCTGDLGFNSSKTYDLEVWLPGQNTYREISSCSNMLDFQARNMQTRYRDSEGKLQLVHTLNGSGLAVGRTLVAIMENYQDAQGRVQIPKVLQAYMGGVEAI